MMSKAYRPGNFPALLGLANDHTEVYMISGAVEGEVREAAGQSGAVGIL